MLNIPVRSEEESGFFIPSDEFFYAIKKENIPKGGEPKRQGWIGVNGFIPVSEEKAKIEGIELPAVMCDGVIPKHPAAEAGIKDTDIILEINGQKLERLANPAFTVQNFMRQIMKFQIGQKVELTVKSGAQKKKITLTVGPMPTLPPEAPRIYDQLLGMLLRERVPLDQYLMKGQASEKEGLIVIAIQKGSLADLYGLSGGDIVIAVNDQPVKTRDAYKAFGDGFFKNNQPVKLKIFRQNQELTIAILPPRQPSGG
jgi:S1-C subfamily serine protease